MPNTELERLVRRLRSLATLSDPAAEALCDLPYRLLSAEMGADLYAAGEETGACFVVLNGCISRYKRRADSSRAVVSFELAGDIVNLESLLLGTVDCGAFANTPSVVALVEQPVLNERLLAYPEIERVLWRAAMIKSATLEEWLMNIGRRPPLARICHLLAELHARLHAVGEPAAKLHASSAEIADAMGLQEVHVVRSLKELEQQKLIDRSSEGITLLDVERLARLGDFSPSYLHLQRRAA